ncbi:methionine--tRNA ligase [Pseudolysobacter antarcticus]|uniref:Methionine--tRNA ligase n=1 Tax=Pseudolysobacter antarcticus TaxID=2511995 RepID=A0A411HLL3_9GAMM|nr:methionine--tRNA ligase [Pseudolysobacter antarcticus]QBB71416.1 methionine--tRNA ligase [Pseudolysobacter antarcticus]
MTHARQLLVTSALPYANGPLHIGHLLGYIQADIWVRARRMAGDTVHFVCADDAHGTAIMLAAEKAGITPEEFIKDIQAGHEKDFAAFHVDFDFYHTTHSPENQELAGHIFTRLRDTGKIARREVRQLYDPIKEMFLPDRYIKGECPVCATPDQYGDNCENCGATYSPTDLKNPRSVVSGATPELRDSEHYFFRVGEFAQFLREWLAGDVAHPSVKAKLKEWLDSEGGVRDWDISRDAPYFGFPIPDAPGKFFYVWLDAPVGYLASFKKYCASEKGRANGLTPASFHQFLRPDDPDFLAESKLHHFIGKDIVNFHGLFWPAMLQGAGYREPTALHVNGYLTVNGAKMSKSRGTFIQARTYLDAGLNAEYLRYYFATMLGAAPTDIDLDLKAFEDRVNSHLVGKFVNIASRCAGFIEKHFDGRLAAEIDADLHAHYEFARNRLEQISSHKRYYEEGDFAQIARDVMNEADYINGLIAGWQPWKLAKDPAQHKLLHQVCTLAINFFRLLTIYLKPIIPATATHIETFLGEKLDYFLQAETLLLGKQIQPFQSLITRIDSKNIEAMIEASKDSLAVEKPAANTAPAKKPAAAKTATNASPVVQSPPAIIAMDDFAKLDLRIGKVLVCEFVEGSDKLLRFQLDAGDLGQRQIFSGIRAAYAEPEKLVGRNVVFIANLTPRKMRFGVSEGMILSAGGSDGTLFLLDADAGALPGMTVK